MDSSLETVPLRYLRSLASIGRKFGVLELSAGPVHLKFFPDEPVERASSVKTPPAPSKEKPSDEQLLEASRQLDLWWTQRAPEDTLPPAPPVKSGEGE